MILHFSIELNNYIDLLTKDSFQRWKTHLYIFKISANNTEIKYIYVLLVYIHKYINI